jgi:hypothetical protein
VSKREGVKLDEAGIRARAEVNPHTSEDIFVLLGALASERARADKAEKALEKYGRHAHACYEGPVYAVEDVHHRGSSYTSGLVKDCVCGLSAALASGEKGER